MFLFCNFIFFLNVSRYSYGENNELTCCSPQSNTSSAVYYFSPFKSLFFSPGAEWRENTEGITKRTEGSPEIRGCWLVLVCLFIDLCIHLCLRLDMLKVGCAGDLIKIKRIFCENPNIPVLQEV